MVLCGQETHARRQSLSEGDIVQGDNGFVFIVGKILLLGIPEVGTDVVGEIPCLYVEDFPHIYFCFR